MNEWHQNLLKRHVWYASWHKTPHISLLHLLVFFGIAVSTAGTVQGAVQDFNNNQFAAAGVSTGKAEGHDFGPWFAISHWKNCPHLMQQGSVFELQNSEGQSMLSECTQQVPERPFDWHSDPARFRLIKEPLPNHDTPMPHPVDPKGRE